MLEEQGSGSNENRKNFHFILSCLKAFKVINWKLWKYVLDSKCYDKKCMANHGYPLYIFELKQFIQYLSMCLIYENWMFVKLLSKEKQSKKSGNVLAKLFHK